ncbi:MAG: 6-phosphofructokinase [Ruminococcaceae bacterium]|nr:6-phosphofructokinase [Oscillospiraceae bacterium]
MKELFGNAVVGQSGGPTAAINATLAGVVRGVVENKGKNIAKLYGMRNGIEGFLQENLIDLSAFFANSEEKLRILEQTPAAALGSCRLKLPKPQDDPGFFERLITIFKKYNIRFFFYIGGNDSMDTVAKLTAYLETCDYEMKAIGIPKTIDNDLLGSDHTPGYGSAAKYIATTMQEILRDCAVYRIPAVTIVELMGRDAGWLTAASAVGRLAGGLEPDYIYLPECVFDLDKFLIDVKKALAKHPNVVIAVSEGVRFANGRYVGEGSQSGATDKFGHAYLAGVGKVLEYAVRDSIGCKVRSLELSLPQRCAAHLASDTDLSESAGVGKAAVSAACNGISGEVMSIVRSPEETYSVQFEHHPASAIANGVRRVNPEFCVPEGNQVTDSFCRWLLPLIQGERNLVYQNGLPAHLTF